MDEIIKVTKKDQPRRLVDLEKAIQELPQADCPITHHFAEGLYVRERFAKKNTLIVGKRHRHETIHFLLKGTLSVYLDGGEVKHYTAPHIWKTEPGSKKMTYSQTDTILVTVHPTTETDLDEIEKEVIIPEEEYLLEQERKLLDKGE